MALSLAIYAISSRAAASESAMAPQGCSEYRTLSNIVWSCITTILLCTWVSYHPDVPDPINVTRLSRWKRIGTRTREFIRSRLLPFLMALLVPEMMLKESLDEFFKARSLAKAHGLLLDQSFFILMDGFYYFERAGGATTNDNATPAAEISNSTEALPLVAEKDDTPSRRLRWSDVVALQNAGKLRIPCSREIQDRSKHDWISKSLVLVQTTWFVAQCIGRRAQCLPLTELEVITLGYTVVNVAIYAIWWKKPYRVEEPVRVYDLPEYKEGLESLEERDNEGFVALFVMGTVFGALHFIAWASSFPTPAERLLWRISTIVLTGVPPLMIPSTILVGLLDDAIDLGDTLFELWMVFLAIIYVVGRAITLVLAFTTLRHLPPDAYRNIEWSNFFPHL